MKKKIIKTISITLGVVVLFLVLLVGYGVYEGGKSRKEFEAQIKKSKEIEIAKQEYFKKINSVKLFGIEFGDPVYKYLKNVNEVFSKLGTGEESVKNFSDLFEEDSGGWILKGEKIIDVNSNSFSNKLSISIEPYTKNID